MLSRSRTRLVAHWLVPSAAAAALGGVVAGMLEGRAMETPIGFVAATGFVALLGAPLLLVGLVILRALWAAWRPHELALIEGDAGAPKLAAWLVVAALGTALVAWIVFQGTWLLVAWTAFKPISVAFGVPAFAVIAALLAVAMSRPVTRGVAAGLRAIDRRWRRRGRRTLLSPWRIACAFVVLAAIGGIVFWWLVLRVRLAGFDLAAVRPLAPALLGIAVAVIAVAAWPMLGRARFVVGPIVAASAVLAILCALAVMRTRPSVALAIWGDRPLAGSTIDALFDIGPIRDRLASIELAPIELSSGTHPDIALVIIDTMRADHAPAYGGGAEMPALMALASRGAVFERAFAPSNSARRSLPSMLTGLGAERVRGTLIGDALHIDPRHVTLAERLVAAGYETAGFVCCRDDWQSANGLDRGLDHVDIERDGLVLAEHARAWLADRDHRGDHEPLFVVVHLIEPRDWSSRSPEPTTSERNRLYDTALAKADRALAIVTAALAPHAPIMIVTSDHGEALGDHAAQFHGTDLYDSQTRVPLVIAGPGIAAVHVAETVSLVGLVPSVLELAGFRKAPADSFDAPSFAALAAGRGIDPNGGVAFGAMLQDRASPSSAADVVVGAWKLIAIGTKRELYNTRADPSEHVNAIGQHRDIADKLERLLDERRAHALRSPFE
ncbi:MAG TPA: sulfatase-like hydrolase/transferase [Kofleriaceae bacterium]|nr:sulfatase-like hydrolase/transferase [Kofleriaceae bacterium]